MAIPGVLAPVEHFRENTIKIESCSDCKFQLKYFIGVNPNPFKSYSGMQWLLFDDE